MDQRTDKEMVAVDDKLEFGLRQRSVASEEETGVSKKLTDRIKTLNERVFQEQNRRIYLSKRLVDILERERRDIAMALHDEAGQILTTLKMDLDMIEGATDCLKQTELLHSAKLKVTGLIDFIRNVSRRLRPSVLDNLGLVAAIGFLIDELREEHVGFDIDFSTQGIPEHMDCDKEIALYRIIQESLNNCIKHANAKKVYIKLIRSEAVLLTIEDDGIGFDYNSVSELNAQGKGPLGITIMRERTAQQKGTFWIESTPGRGTVVSVRMPVGEDYENPASMRIREEDVEYT